MIGNKTKKEKMYIEIDSGELSEAQQRMLKTMNILLNHVLTTDNESEYFDGAAEAMRICASLIKQANFTQALHANDIPYAQQALEFSLETLQEHMGAAKVISYDN